MFTAVAQGNIFAQNPDVEVRYDTSRYRFSGYTYGTKVNNVGTYLFDMERTCKLKFLFQTPGVMHA
jgi:hypothetical protein